MPSRPQAKDTPSSVTQIAAVMAALGLYGGANTPAEHAAEARRLGGDAAYRLRLVNALLGAAQAEALVAESLPVSPDDRLAAYEQQLATAGVVASPTKRIRFLRWQTLRVAGPLREMAQHVETGPIPLAAAHAVLFSDIVTPAVQRHRGRWAATAGRLNCRPPGRHDVAEQGEC